MLENGEWRVWWINELINQCTCEWGIILSFTLHCIRLIFVVMCYKKKLQKMSNSYKVFPDILELFLTRCIYFQGINNWMIYSTMTVLKLICYCLRYRKFTELLVNLPKDFTVKSDINWEKYFPPDFILYSSNCYWENDI